MLRHLLAFALLACAVQPASAREYAVSVDTSALDGSLGYLDFQLIPSVATAPWAEATVAIQPSSDIVRLSSTYEGDVSILAPFPERSYFSMRNTTAFNSVLVEVQFGASFGFWVSLDTTTSSSDFSAFSLALLNADQTTSLLTTDPSGTVVTFQIESPLAQTINTFEVAPGVASVVSVSPVPEPSTYVMLIVGMLLVSAAARRRSRLAAHGAQPPAARTHRRSALATLSLGACLSGVMAPSLAQVTSLDLSNYRHVATYALPSVSAAEASAVTWNWDNDRLFVLGDEGDALVEVDKRGTQLSSMSLTGFIDTEGLTYIGAGQFVVTEERLQDAYLLTYAPGGSAARDSLPTVSLGETVGNVGIEGQSYDPLTGRYVLVKEKTPQAVRSAAIDFSAGTASIVDLFAPALSVLDLSDVQVLSTVPSLRGSAEQDNLLIFSQESARLLEVSPSGSVLSQFDFSSIASDAEGVTIDASGTIFVVGEAPALYVLSPVPEAQSYLLLLSGLAMVAGAVRRKRAR